LMVVVVLVVGMIVLMFVLMIVGVFMAVIVTVRMSVGVVIAVTVTVTVTMTMTMTMSVSMFVHSMVSLRLRNQCTILISLEIPTLDKVGNHKHTARSEALLQLLRRKRDIFEVVEAKADSRQVETLPLSA
jgi:hypothetical protein